MATMTLAADSGAIIARSTNGRGFNIEINDTLTAISMKKVVDSTSIEATLSLEGGKFYIYETPLTSLTISEVESSTYESAILFTAAATDTALITVYLPENIKIIGLLPAFASGNSYLMSFRDGMCVVGEITP